MSETLKEQEMKTILGSRFAKWEASRRKNKDKAESFSEEKETINQKKKVVKKELPIHLRVGF